jgi:hypothetical protein
MIAWETQDDTGFVETAMQQIAKELKLSTSVQRCPRFSDFNGIQYDDETSAQSAILQRAATLKEVANDQGFIRLN